MAGLLQVCNLSCAKDKEHSLFSNLNFVVNEEDVVILQGKSGVGKTSLLKCVAHLNMYGGEVLYRGRTKVSYVPQRPSLLAGTPRDFLKTVTSFRSRAPKVVRRIEVANAWGIDEELWDRNWSNLSGGESQRIALAIAVGLNTAEVLLLDEPTSALDPYSTTLLRSTESELKAIIWITHSEEQARRVGTRFLQVTPTGCEEEPSLSEP
ncbi:P-loop containing nucleoside triphosphate hydrolase protein [Pisolithus croceorrhizus]|nr:P-loop containing nucleoside triphosphate hydrolase protein [Pisolithus croceorrhizus]